MQTTHRMRMGQPYIHPCIMYVLHSATTAHQTITALVLRNQRSPLGCGTNPQDPALADLV